MTTFEIVLSALQESNKPLAQKCFAEIKNDRILFDPGFEDTFDHLYGIYKRRCDDAQNRQASGFNVEELKVWANAMIDLEISEVDRLSFCVLYSETYVYYIFLDPLSNNLLAIFGCNTNKPLTELILLNDENFNKGLTVSSIIYEYGKMVHEWKCV
jgi:hypothetical protein